jgi:hypothetical protein
MNYNLTNIILLYLLKQLSNYFNLKLKFLCDNDTKLTWLWNVCYRLVCVVEREKKLI